MNPEDVVFSERGRHKKTSLYNPVCVTYRRANSQARLEWIRGHIPVIAALGGGRGRKISGLSSIWENTSLGCSLEGGSTTLAVVSPPHCVVMKK